MCWCPAGYEGKNCEIGRYQGWRPLRVPSCGWDTAGCAVRHCKVPAGLMALGLAGLCLGEHWGSLLLPTGISASPHWDLCSWGSLLPSLGISASPHWDLCSSPALLSPCSQGRAPCTLSLQLCCPAVAARADVAQSPSFVSQHEPFWDSQPAHLLTAELPRPSWNPHCPTPLSLPHARLSSRCWAGQDYPDFLSMALCLIHNYNYQQQP